MYDPNQRDREHPQQRRRPQLRHPSRPPRRPPPQRDRTKTILAKLESDDTSVSLPSLQAKPKKKDHGRTHGRLAAQFAVSGRFFYYYRTPRGYHPRGINSNTAWTAATRISFFSFPLYANIEMISPRPILLIAGEKAHSRYYSENLYKMASEPKELLIVSGADHVDLYDQLDKIPFAKITEFFTTNLK